MGKLRFLIAIIVGKVSAFLLDKIFKRGTNTPGVIMLKICPDALSRFVMPRKTICVTGTNGKTGTSNLLTHIIRSSGKTVVNNSIIYAPFRIYFIFVIVTYIAEFFNT